MNETVDAVTSAAINVTGQAAEHFKKRSPSEQFFE